MAVYNLPASPVHLSGPEFGIGPSDTPLELASGTTQGYNWGPHMASVMASRFPNGNVTVVIDRAITGYTPWYGSHVTFQGLNDGCGIKRPQSWLDSVIYNGDPVLGTRSGTPILPTVGAGGPDAAVTIGGWRQSNLRVRGLTLHGGANDVPDFVRGVNGPMTLIRIWGCDGAEVSGCNLYDSPTYHLFAANTQDLRVHNNTIRTPTGGTGNGTGRDGVHLAGPHRRFWIERNTIGVDDDSVACNANDGNTLHLGFPFAMPGDQTDGTIASNVFDGSVEGVRMISSARRVDNIRVVGNSGWCLNAGFLMDTLNLSGAPDLGFSTDTGPTGFANQEPGPGNFGTILVEDHNVRSTLDGLGTGPMWVQGNFEQLTILNATFAPAGAVTRPFLWVYPGSVFGQLEYQIKARDPAGVPRVLCQDDGTGLTVRGRASIVRPGQSAAAMPAYRKTSGSLKALDLDAQAELVTNLVDYAGGTIESASLWGTHRGAGGGNGSVSVATGLVLTNLATHGLKSALAKSGAGTVTHQYPSGETYSFA